MDKVAYNVSINNGKKQQKTKESNDEELVKEILAYSQNRIQQGCYKPCYIRVFNATGKCS